MDGATFDNLAVTAHHEAGHAVATVMRGGAELVSVTIESAEDYLGRTTQRIKPTDSAFVTYAGPWAEARYLWQTEPTGEFDFEDYVGGALLSNPDDAKQYQQAIAAERAMLESAINNTGIALAELLDVAGREQLWGRELEDRWPEIQQVARMLLDGEGVDHETVDRLLWGEETE